MPGAGNRHPRTIFPTIQLMFLGSDLAEPLNLTRQPTLPGLEPETRSSPQPFEDSAGSIFGTASRRTSACQGIIPALAKLVSQASANDTIPSAM
jgi:hypothetical protein